MSESKQFGEQVVVPSALEWGILRRGSGEQVHQYLNRVVSERMAQAWDEGVDAAFRGAILRQNADDVKRTNPHRTSPAAEVRDV